MRDTPVPEHRMDLERLPMAAALQRARRALVARPRATALDLAQAAVFPLLQAVAVDVFDLRTLRLAAEPSARLASYRLLNGDERVAINVHSADGALPDSGERLDARDWVLTTNGLRWRASTTGSRRLEFELFEAGFPDALHSLLRSDGAIEERFDRADEALSRGRLERGVERLIASEGPARLREWNEDPSLLEQRLRRQGDLARSDGRNYPEREASEVIARILHGRDGSQTPAPLERITLEEVRAVAEQVRHLRGKLEARFDGQPIEITSRSAFYFVLAALALHHGRPDAIPADDLVQPPDEPPASRRARPLDREGWHLLLDHQPLILEERTRSLLGALNLDSAFTVTQRGEPYPSLT